MIDRESQSALLLGYAGTGKSLVLDRVLRSLAQEALSKARATATAGGKRKRQKKNDSGVENGGAGSCRSTAPGENVPSPLPPRHQQQERQQQGEQQQGHTQPFRVVHLNGAAQVDDGVAMREIVQQLGITGAASQGSVYNRSDRRCSDYVFDYFETKERDGSLFFNSRVHWGLKSKNRIRYGNK